MIKKTFSVFRNGILFCLRDRSWGGFLLKHNKIEIVHKIINSIEYETIKVEKVIFKSVIGTHKIQKSERDVNKPKMYLLIRDLSKLPDSL